ncbi:AMP-dependent synthetase and ligase [Hesseltinella vesiculosa]|uniref:AMP-dependent synthetase and ligase n=1 Tax=Hesseltinella vesiculosa TaxID=101127 RepID=A0A1X2GKV6_9FUNG|nr:AMP-dependent synthetase and ligase [Hesseltinella vesiculosa]
MSEPTESRNNAQRRLASVASHLNRDQVPFFDTLRLNRSPDQLPYISPLDPLRFLLRSAMVYTDKIAVSHRGVEWSFRQLTERVQRLAHGLMEDYQIKPGDRVGILCQNIPSMVEAHFAIPAAGAIMVPLNTRLLSAEIEYAVNHAGCSLLIVQDELMSHVSANVQQKIPVLHVADRPDAPDQDPYEQFLNRHSSSPRPWNDMPLVNDENAIISINFTSGSTSMPKGVMVSYRGAYLTALNDCIQGGLCSSSVMLWTLPMFHCNGWGFIWAMVAIGGKQLMLSKMDYGRIWQCFKEQGVTHYNGAPTVHNEICNHPQAVRLPSPVRVLGGGAAFPSPLIKKLVALNLQPTQVYGLTETFGPNTLSYETWHLETAHPENKEKQYAMMARTGYNTIVTDEIRVLNPDTGKDVPSDGTTIGEVCFSGNTNMTGYYNNPEETSKAFRHGFFNTGDLAVRHTDGVIEIVDRSKDVIISGGENISSIEVEAALIQLPTVFECAVVGGPDDKWGERPFAFLVLKPGNSLTEADVIAHCKKNLAGYKCPAKVMFVKSLPKTSTGKVQKFILRNDLWKGKTKKI